jgi:hypothetical protein
VEEKPDAAMGRDKWKAVESFVSKPKSIPRIAHFRLDYAALHPRRGLCSFRRRRRPLRQFWLAEIVGKGQILGLHPSFNLLDQK